jgi:hypothetical protein
MQLLSLDELMQADLASMTFSDISSSVHSAMDKVAIMGTRHYPPSIFLRMRAGSALAQHRKDLSYNPNRESIRWGRCNEPGKPIFYASNSPVGLPGEIHAKVGDILNLGYWRSRTTVLLSTFGFSEGVRRRMGTTLRFPSGQPDLDATALSPSTTRAHQFLMDAFTETVAANEERKYMLTTAIYQILSGDINASVEKGVPELRFDGVTFPSIAVRGNLLNFALRPAVVDSSLELFRVEAFEVTKVRGTEYDVRPISTGFPALDGTIEWGEFENEFKVELALSTATVIHGKPDFRILTPDGGEAAGF